MRILHLISSEGYFGAEAMLVSLARHSERLGCTVAIGVIRDILGGYAKLAEQAENLGMTVRPIACERRWDWTVISSVRREMEQFSADLLHTHGYKADFYGSLAAWPRRVALVASCHNWPSPGRLMRAYYALDRRVLRRFDAVSAVSESVARILRRSGVDAERVTVIPNGVDIGAFEAARSMVRDEAGLRGRVIGFVGRFVEAKGGSVLLAAAQKVLRQFPNATFLFVGDGPLRPQWEQMAASLGITARVAFVGIRSDMPAVYASMDILTLPSFEEASPMCVREAMAAGTPVICTPVGDLPSLIQPGITGFLVPAGDPDQLSDRILLLLRDPELALRVGANGHAFAVREASAERMAARYLEIYRRVVPERSHLEPGAALGQVQ